MDLSFEEQIQNANVLLQENEVEKSIENYMEALRLASTSQQKIHLYGVLGRLYQKTKNPKKALYMFEQAMDLMEGHSEGYRPEDKASVFNNLAALYAETDKGKAIDNYKKALDIFTEIVSNGNTEFLPHLANTQFALAEVYSQKNDYYAAKKYYKEAIRGYESMPNPTYQRLRASAHYQLGNIYTEEFNLFDAKVHYLKALSLFEGLLEEGEEVLKPYLAAVLNNLGVTFKSMGESEIALEHYNKALIVYQDLLCQSLDFFEPYVAATYNSLGILYAEVNNYGMAVEHLRKAVNLYNALADIRPQEYTHYLATGLHNLGLFHFELKEFEMAKDYFGQALEIRKKLAAEQPKNFDADYCTTALNMVELYQSELERNLDFDNKAKALELLKDVEVRLHNHGEERPVIKSMKSDCKHYLDHFNAIDVEQVSLHAVLRKVNDLMEEINGTIVPEEKLVFQQEIIEVLTAKFKQFPNNDRLRNELVNAHTNLSWLYLRLKEFNKVERTAMDAPKQEQPALSLQCNLAHCYLLQGQMDKALELYAELKEQTNGENEKYRDVVLKDFEILKRDGIHHGGFETVRQSFQ